MAMKFHSIVLMVSQREITKDYAYMFAKIAWNMEKLTVTIISQIHYKKKKKKATPKSQEVKQILKNKIMICILLKEL